MNNYKNFYFIGIGGIGMSALARYFKSLGKNVLGYDKTQTKLIEKLQEEEIVTSFEDKISEEIQDLQKEDTLVIYTPAIKQLGILEYFQNQGFEILKRAKVLGLITQNTECIAVAGTHGKTTTSSLVAHLCKEVNLSFSGFLGGISENFGSNFIFNGNQYSVLEADEYDRSFLNLSPNWAIITSTDADHLDIYGDKGTIEASFNEFANLVDEENQLFVRKGVEIKRNAKTYAVNEIADYFSDNLQMRGDKISFDFHLPNGNVHRFEWDIPGVHNVENATGALALLYNLGVDIEILKKALANFRGIKRRYTKHEFPNGKIYIDDYAHHPTEIAATLKAAKEMGRHRVICAFQPHRYSRTKLLQEEFSEAFIDADVLFFTDIYAAGESPIQGIDGTLIPNLVKRRFPDKPINYVKNVEDLPKELYKVIKPDDMLITMGAGNIYMAGEMLANLMKGKGLSSDYKK